jgi:uncharacterized protein (TIGR03790 family)
MDGILHRRMLGMLPLLYGALAFDVEAGGSGLNTVVVVNHASADSRELGNYYCERRQVPPENVLRIHWPGTNTVWTSNDFGSLLLTPLLDMLATRQLTSQVDYVVLSMDIPFQTSFGSTVNSTTSALFYGLKSAGEPGVTNSYAASENVFRLSRPASAPGFSFLTTMITAGTLGQAKALVDQGVAGDATLPTRPVVLAKSSDPVRNIRHFCFDNAILNVRIQGASILRTNTDSLLGQTGLLGCATGLEKFSLSPDTFVPGAIGDSMTSFGGVIFGPNSQTDLLEFIHAGAAGSYGTVAEPYTDTQKFPNSQVYFYQARGFSLAESYYQSVNAPYLGLTVAEPLGAPFARVGSGKWNLVPPDSVLDGTVPLSVQFCAAGASEPLQQIDLFVDGKYFSTLTNLAPAPGNVLTVELNGYPVAYTVPANATLDVIAGELAALLNTPAVTNATRVKARALGDRVELQSFATNGITPIYVADPEVTNSTGRFYSVTYLPDSFPPRMIPASSSESGVFRMQVEIPTDLPYVIEASTNLADWLPIFTNTRPGLVSFEDVEATDYPARFYRVVGPPPGQPPKLSAPGPAGGGAVQMRIESAPGRPCAILASSNLVHWTFIVTNQSGGVMDFVDTSATDSTLRFYRAWLVPPAAPGFTVVNGVTGATLVRVDDAVRPFKVAVSTNLGRWTTLATNFLIREIRTAAGSSAGSAGQLSTFLKASRSTFLDSEALGFQGYTVVGGTPSVGAWLQMVITKTNNVPVVLGVTNQSAGTAASALAAQLCAMINTNPALQGVDGVAAEDFVIDQTGAAAFCLRARSAGYQAAGVCVSSSRSGIIIVPSAQRTLTQNLSDLVPRNHLTITAGAGSLDAAFALDTATLPDGYHELTAVAYEGSHVRTQTRRTLPVRIHNSPLEASLTLLDLPDPAPVEGVYHIEVAANTNDVSAITLFSTGGVLAVVTNQPTATFEVQGANVCAGLHPFYALVETAGGLKYRTETKRVRFVNEP